MYGCYIYPEYTLNISSISDVYIYHRIYLQCLFIFTQNTPGVNGAPVASPVAKVHITENDCVSWRMGVKMTEANTST